MSCAKTAWKTFLSPLFPPVECWTNPSRVYFDDHCRMMKMDKLSEFKERPKKKLSSLKTLNQHKKSDPSGKHGTSRNFKKPKRLLATSLSPSRPHESSMKTSQNGVFSPGPGCLPTLFLHLRWVSTKIATINSCLLKQETYPDPMYIYVWICFKNNVPFPQVGYGTRSLGGWSPWTLLGGTVEIDTWLFAARKRLGRQSWSEGSGGFVGSFVAGRGGGLFPDPTVIEKKSILLLWLSNAGLKFGFRPKSLWDANTIYSNAQTNKSNKQIK